MGKEPFLKTVPWSPYWLSGAKYNSSSWTAKCSVCGMPAECYLDNTHYCGSHGDKALRRHRIVHQMIKEANEKGNYAIDRLFQQQPDLHNHAKWLRIHEGMEKYVPPEKGEVI